MSKLTDKLAADLDDCIIENFADIYTLEDALKRIERQHDLDDPDVIAALATCADVASAQARLTPRPSKALARGLKSALDRGSLRATAALMVRALLAGALLEGDGPTATPKKLPELARPARLPTPVTAAGRRASPAEIEALVREIAAARPGAPPATSFTPASLAELGRALALGWLSHGSDPKHAWAAFAAAAFPDDATARDLGMMARELGPRVGQFKKAQVLVDVLAAMNTRASLEALHELATKVKTASVRDRARAAFDATAKRLDVSVHGLADRLIKDDAPLGKDFVKRLEQRMVTASEMSVVELVENILQRDAARTAATGVVFGARTGKKLTTFTIAKAKNAELVDIDGRPFVPASNAAIVVVHPIDLSEAQRTKWRGRIARAPFRQLERPLHELASVTTMTRTFSRRFRDAGVLAEGPFRGLEALGWTREVGPGGTISKLTRQLDGIHVTIELEPGISAGRGMARRQRVMKVATRGRGPARALSEIARELETLLA